MFPIRPAERKEHLEVAASGVVPRYLESQIPEVDGIKAALRYLYSIRDNALLEVDQIESEIIELEAERLEIVRQAETEEWDNEDFKSVILRTIDTEIQSEQLPSEDSEQSNGN